MEDDFAPIEHSWLVGVGRQSGQYIYILYGPDFLPTPTDQLCSIGADCPPCHTLPYSMGLYYPLQSVLSGCTYAKKNLTFAPYLLLTLGFSNENLGHPYIQETTIPYIKRNNWDKKWYDQIAKLFWNKANLECEKVEF